MNLSGKTTVSTKASSINRALDEIGDKWCLLILQEVFWGINTFSDMLAGTGASRGVLSNRLNWLQSVGCLRKDITVKGEKRPTYHMTKKSIELYRNGLMAMIWERKYFTTPALDSVELIHDRCGKAFWPIMECSHCNQSVLSTDVSFHKDPGAKNDIRIIKTRRRSSNPSSSEERGKTLYLSLIHI
mgnify:FL=1